MKTVFLHFIIMGICLGLGAIESAEVPMGTEPSLLLEERLQELDDKLTPDMIRPFLNEKDEHVFATVDGVSITFRMIRNRYRTMLRNYINIYPEIPLTENTAINMKRDCIEHYIHKEVLRLEFVKRDLFPDDQKKQELLDQFLDLPKVDSDNKYQIFLRSQALTEEQLLEEISFQHALHEFYAQEKSQVPETSLEEAQEYYEANHDRFMTEEKIAYSVIAIKNSTEESDVIEKNKSLINQIRTDIVSGKKTFEYYARNFSDDILTRKNSGLVDLTPISQLPQNFDFLLELPLNQISQIISYQKSFMIFRVNEKEEPSLRSFEEMRQDIIDWMHRRALLQRYRGKVNALMSSCEITRNY